MKIFEIFVARSYHSTVIRDANVQNYFYLMLSQWLRKTVMYIDCYTAYTTCHRLYIAGQNPLTGVHGPPELRFWHTVMGGMEKVNLPLTLGMQEGEKWLMEIVRNSDFPMMGLMKCKAGTVPCKGAKSFILPGKARVKEEKLILWVPIRPFCPLLLM